LARHSGKADAGCLKQVFFPFCGNDLILSMNFFQYLFCNQYAEINGRGGNTRQAQINTILLSTVLITLYIVIAFVVYDQFYPGFLEKRFSSGYANGKTAGRFLAAVIGLMVFFVLKFFIGTKHWYDKTVEQYTGMLPEEQKRTSKKGIRYFFIAALPVIVFIVWALISVF
jgi:hypothetical protein